MVAIHLERDRTPFAGWSHHTIFVHIPDFEANTECTFHDFARIMRARSTLGVPYCGMADRSDCYRSGARGRPLRLFDEIAEKEPRILPLVQKSLER